MNGPINPQERNETLRPVEVLIKTINEITVEHIINRNVEQANGPSDDTLDALEELLDDQMRYRFTTSEDYTNKVARALELTAANPFFKIIDFAPLRVVLEIEILILF